MRIIILFLFLTTALSSQNKRDYLWFFGKDQVAGPDFGATVWNFNNKPFEPEIRTGGLEFDQNNASICNEDGELLFYSNGCAVANRLHQVMPNGDSINAGLFFDLVWRGNCRFGYPGGQDITILPDPGNRDGYYLITKPEEFYNDDILDDIIIAKLNYSYIDMTLDNGLGDVVEKNVPFAEGRFLWSYLTSIGHANGEDWWILNPDEFENIYHTYLLSASGIEWYDSQKMGDIRFNRYSSASGDTKFSPDGSKYCFYNKHDGLFLYDFNRDTGQLSNFRKIIFPEPEQITFYSCEFSPDSRLLYLMEGRFLYQLDTEADDLEASIMLIAEYNGVGDPIYSENIAMTLGPDCRIYVRPGSSSNSFHVVNKPNLRGTACDYVQQGIRLPYISAVGSFPNFPRFRVDEEEKCDPSIVSGFGEDIFWRRDMTVFPNPATDHITVELPEHPKGTLFMINMEGQVVLQEEVIGSEQKRLDTYQLPKGSYSVEFVPHDNQERLVYTAQLILI